MDLKLERMFSWSALRARLGALVGGPAGSPQRARWLVGAAVVVLAFIPRLILLLQLEDGAPTFHDPEGGDSRFYDAIAAGETAPPRAYFHSPLYRWFLAGLYDLFGRDLFAVRVVQLLLGVVAAWLAYQLALRLFRRVSIAATAGLAAGLLGPAAFYEGQLLVDGLIALLALVVLHLVLDASRRPSLRAYLLVGLTLGVAALARAVFLIWLPLLIWFVATSSGDRRERLRFLAALVGGVALSIAPVTVRNYLVEGDFVLITANAGLNLYVGNNPRANGGYQLPEGLWFRPGDPLDDFAGFTAASQALGHEPSSSELSRWWASKASSYVATHPAAALGLLKEKLRILINDYEYPQMVNYTVYGEVAPVLKVLPGAGFVVPAGLVGMAAMWLGRHGRRRRLLAALIISYALAFLPFFVTGRYRVAWLVLLAPFAAWTVVQIVLAARRRRWRRTCALVVATSLGLVLTCWPLRAYPSRANQHMDFVRALLRIGDRHRAAHFARRATELEPTRADAWALRGRVLRLAGEGAAAVELLTAQAATHPQAPALQRELGAALLAVGRPRQAAVALEVSINLRPGNTKAWMWLAQALEELGCWSQAAEAYQTILRFAPRTAAAQRAQLRLDVVERQLTEAPEGSSPTPADCSW
ncbi:MAG: glycosyltransferase family 39 protein [Deltaproteobacteria bacterium]|nr:glycosyltransferase family 39 protein [Deltaproteobacteria bacterium]